MSRRDDDLLFAVSEEDGLTHAEVTELVALLREGPVELEDAPAGVWESIESQVSADVQAENTATRERRNWPLLTSVAAASALVATVGTLVVTTVEDDVPVGDVVAQAALLDLSTEAAAGTAVVEEREDGARVLVVDVDSLESTDGYLEVWLIDESVVGMISLGHLTEEHAEFVIPEDFPVSEFPIVDISIEPLDGNPAHSGQSITRGILDENTQ